MNNAGKIYATSPLKRSRATKHAVSERLDSLVEIVQEIQPCTVRQVFYQATVRDLVEKSESGYGKVQRALVALRRDGRIPYGFIVDNTRWMRKPRSFDGPRDALENIAHLYRRNLWLDAEVYVEIWLEKDALSGVIYPITAGFDVPLMVARGYASLSFLAEAAETIRNQGRPTFIYHLGDYDPSGVDAGRNIEKTLRELAPESEIHFERLAVNVDQIEMWDLPSRPTKLKDSRALKFGSDTSVELDSIRPETLRNIVHNAVERWIPPRAMDILRVAEESERIVLLDLAERWGEK